MQIVQVHGFEWSQVSMQKVLTMPSHQLILRKQLISQIVFDCREFECRLSEVSYLLDT